MLRLVFFDSSLRSPGQEKHFSILFIPLCVVAHEIQLSGEAEEEERKIFKRRFLDFYKADLKSEARFVLGKVRAFRRL